MNHDIILTKAAGSTNLLWNFHHVLAVGGPIKGEEVTWGGGEVRPRVNARTPGMRER